MFNAQYLVQNPPSVQIPVGTATLCLANSCLMIAGRLHSSQFPAQPPGLKLSSMRFSVRGAPEVKELVSTIRSQQGTVLSISLGGAPAGLMLNTVLSAEWKSWKEKHGGGTTCWLLTGSLFLLMLHKTVSGRQLITVTKGCAKSVALKAVWPNSVFKYT